jgi:hypothetical protein
MCPLFPDPDTTINSNTFLALTVSFSTNNPLTFWVKMARSGYRHRQAFAQRKPSLQPALAMNTSKTPFPFRFSAPIHHRKLGV